MFYTAWDNLEENRGGGGSQKEGRG